MLFLCAFFHSDCPKAILLCTHFGFHHIYPERRFSMSKVTFSISQSLAEATGPIDYTFTNDYMFRAILQKNLAVLKALICCLLHIPPEQVKSVEITNPIVLGQHIDSKEFVLDITVVMNDNTHINLEMQVENENNWQYRSLSYLCRSYDHLAKGQDYALTGAAIHIGFLDFTPFPEAPEFYAKYQLMNVKNHGLYTGKFELNVLDLNQIELATEEDKAYGIDHWARLFKAKTWEDLKMIAKQNAALQQATETLYALNCDQTIRDMCRAREDAIRHENRMKRELAEANAALSDAQSMIADKDAALADAMAEIAKLKAKLGEK